AVSSSAGPVFQITSTQFASCSLGVDYSQTVQTVNATGAVTCTSSSGTGDFATGISFHGSTCTLSGTPTTAGSFTFTVTATDSASNTDTKQIHYALTCPSLQITNPLTTLNCIQGTSCSYSYQTAGGVSPFS